MMSTEERNIEFWAGWGVIRHAHKEGWYVGMEFCAISVHARHVRGRGTLSLCAELKQVDQSCMCAVLRTNEHRKSLQSAQ